EPGRPPLASRLHRDSVRDRVRSTRAWSPAKIPIRLETRTCPAALIDRPDADAASLGGATTMNILCLARSRPRRLALGLLGTLALAFSVGCGDGSGSLVDDRVP